MISSTNARRQRGELTDVNGTQDEQSSVAQEEDLVGELDRFDVVAGNSLTREGVRVLVFLLQWIYVAAR